MCNSKIAGNVILLATASWILLYAVAAKAATKWQDHDAIRSTALSFATAFSQNRHSGRSEVKLGSIDSRVRLKACKRPLEGFMSPGGREVGNTTIGVRCPDEGGWNLYVSAKINAFGEVLVASRPIQRGDLIQVEDLVPAERNLAKLPYGSYSPDLPPQGMIAKRTISANTVLTPPMLQAIKLVRRGEQVTIIAQSGPISVRRSGKALMDGTEGQLIRVQALGSKNIVEGTVSSQGIIKVTF